MTQWWLIYRSLHQHAEGSHKDPYLSFLKDGINDAILEKYKEFVDGTPMACMLLDSRFKHSQLADQIQKNNAKKFLKNPYTQYSPDASASQRTQTPQVNSSSST